MSLPPAQLPERSSDAIGTAPGGRPAGAAPFSTECRSEPESRGRGWSRLEPHLRFLLGLAPAAMVFLMVVGRFLIPAIWAHPVLGPLVSRPCAFEAATSVPCPFCGGTRAVVAASQGRWADAARLSPLGFLICAGGGLLSLWLAAASLSGYALGLHRAGRMLHPLARPASLALILLVLWALKIVSTKLWPG